MFQKLARCVTQTSSTTFSYYKYSAPFTRTGPSTLPPRTTCTTRTMSFATQKSYRGGVKDDGISTTTLPEIPLLILDLNETLLKRIKKGQSGSATPCVRPYLSTFLEYICGQQSDAERGKISETESLAASEVSSSDAVERRSGHESETSEASSSELQAATVTQGASDAHDRFLNSKTKIAPLGRHKSVQQSADPVISTKKRWDVITYTSAHGRNAVLMLRAIGLITVEQFDILSSSHRVPLMAGRPVDFESIKHWYNNEWKPNQSKTGHLSLIWSREMMSLDYQTFHGSGYGGSIPPPKPPKDLAAVWRLVGRGSHNTVLFDNDQEKSGLQPFNHLPIQSFVVENHIDPVPTLVDLMLKVNLSSHRAPPSPTELPLHLRENDDCLLGAIYLLETLRSQSDFADYIQSGKLAKLTKDLGPKALAEAGRKVCEDVGIRVSSGWDSDWVDRVMKQRNQSV